MDKGKITRLVLIPIVAGLIVTLIVQRLTTQSQQAATAEQVVDLVPVVVVASNEPIPVRTRILESQLVVKEIPKELATGSEFDELKDVVGKIAMVELQPGEVVRTQRVVEEGQGALPYRIPAGKRAVTIRMDELNGVAGHPDVGDLVDLILFLPEKTDEEESLRPTSARILFEGVPILARGLATQEGAKGDQKALSSVTLALSPEAAVEVALAEQIGYIKMVLRPALRQPDAGAVTITEEKYMPAAPAPAPNQPGH